MNLNSDFGRLQFVALLVWDILPLRVSHFITLPDFILKYLIPLPVSHYRTTSMASPASSASRLPSLIDTLDEPSVRALFRFLSDKPRHPRWSRYIASEDLHAMLRFGGAIRNEAMLFDTRVELIIKCISIKSKRDRPSTAQTFARRLIPVCPTTWTSITCHLLLILDP